MLSFLYIFLQSTEQHVMFPIKRRVVTLIRRWWMWCDTIDEALLLRRWSITFGRIALLLFSLNCWRIRLKVLLQVCRVLGPAAKLNPICHQPTLSTWCKRKYCNLLISCLLDETFFWEIQLVKGTDFISTVSEYLKIV